MYASFLVRPVELFHPTLVLSRFASEKCWKGKFILYTNLFVFVTKGKVFSSFVSRAQALFLRSRQDNEYTKRFIMNMKI